jgi:hypothetical protein
VKVVDISPPHLTAPPQGGEESLLIGQAAHSTEMGFYLLLCALPQSVSYPVNGSRNDEVETAILGLQPERFQNKNNI